MARLAHLHLAVGFGAASVLLAAKGLALPAEVWLLRPIHIEVLLVGYFMQLAMGVAVWILPRAGAAPGRLLYAAAIVLNLGVGVAAAAMVLRQPGMLLAARLAVAVSAVAFAVHLWQRVRAARAQNSRAD